MIPILRKWQQQYLSQEEAIVLILMLAVSSIVLWLWGSIFFPIIAAVIFAYILQGMINRLQNWGMPFYVAFLITFFAFIGLCTGLILIVLPVVWRQCVALSRELPFIFSQLQDILLALQKQYPTFINTGSIREWSESLTSEVASIVQHLLQAWIASLQHIIRFTIYIILIPILIFFLLKDKDKIIKTVEQYLPRKRTFLVQIWRDMDINITGYLRGKVIEMLVVGITSYICFVLFGLNYAALLALGSGLSVFVPLIGAIVITIPIVIIAFLQWGMEPIFLWLCVSYIVLQLLDGYLLVPLLFAETVNISPLTILISILIFGGLWGFWGVFFAIPLVTFIKVLLNTWPQKRKDVADPS